MPELAAHETEPDVLGMQNLTFKTPLGRVSAGGMGCRRYGGG